ncbi:MAG TPA: hypothetical protein DC013_09380, partial [Ruminococcaceae bacterium]|nr:hypothetical protein [Oscillospiraceae bacterium]
VGIQHIIFSVFCFLLHGTAPKITNFLMVPPGGKNLPNPDGAEIPFAEKQNDTTSVPDAMSFDGKALLQGLQVGFQAPDRFF